MIKSLKPLALLAIPLAFSPLNAQTTTDPVGVVKITIAAAPSAGATKLTAISATLRNSISYQGTATSVGTFATDAQPLETGVTTWTANQWTTEAHLCYIENAAGAEEAYLITAMDEATGQLTLATTFDISTRYTATPTYRIVKAHTLGDLFGKDSATVPFQQSTDTDQADLLYIWDGNTWDTYYHNATNWKKIGLFGNAENTVIFPDEGIFILRRATTDIILTLNGSVPTKNQITTIPGEAQAFISNRFPVGSTVADLGFETLPNWSKSTDTDLADKFYIWDGNTWDTYYHNGTDWKKIGLFGAADTQPIAADSAIFVSRGSAALSVTSDNTHTLPYSN